MLQNCQDNDKLATDFGFRSIIWRRSLEKRWYPSSNLILSKGKPNRKRDLQFLFSAGWVQRIYFDIDLFAQPLETTYDISSSGAGPLLLTW